MSQPSLDMDGPGTSGAVLPTGRTADEQVPPPQPYERNEYLDGLVRELNQIRADLSSMWADDMKVMGMKPLDYNPFSLKEMDRQAHRNKMRQREAQVMSEIRDLRGGM